MYKKMIKSLATLALIFGLAQSAFAAESQDVVVGPGKQPVKSEKFGTCVQTKWTAASNPCEPAPAPQPVVAAPAPAPAPVVQQPVSRLAHEQLTIYFNFNKADLTENAKIKLDAIADAVRHSPRVLRVKIVGYTDEIGTSSYNDKLSVKRANAVQAYLARRVNIDVNVIGLRGMGEKDPVVDCSKVKARKKKIACMARDRRVEIEFDFQK
ncbi:MAG TPA: OmpA family protein [Rickettsiales bacterium]|nr:OmpA family protein [Rickettsiales bacterium]